MDRSEAVGRGLTCRVVSCKSLLASDN